MSTEMNTEKMSDTKLDCSHGAIVSQKVMFRELALVMTRVGVLGFVTASHSI
jgi:hypothetical protein